MPKDEELLDLMRPVVGAALAWAAARESWLELNGSPGIEVGVASEARLLALAREEDLASAVDLLIHELGRQRASELGLDAPAVSLPA